MSTKESRRFDLSGKIALVTGGAGLLGTQHAIALAECGAYVYIADIEKSLATKVADRINSELELNLAEGVKLDVTNKDELNEFKNDVTSKENYIQILVNNAAIDSKVSGSGEIKNAMRFENTTLETWDKEYSVGLTGAFLCCQVFGCEMAERKAGVVLNIASDLSVIAPDQTLYQISGLAPAEQPVKPVTYSVIKHGLVGLTKYLASYWGHSGVRVNALSPGGVFNNQDKRFVEKVSSKIPLGRMAFVDEYRSSVQYLCSDASSYMSGQNIVVDGGRSII